MVSAQTTIDRVSAVTSIKEKSISRRHVIQFGGLIGAGVALAPLLEACASTGGTGGSPSKSITWAFTSDPVSLKHYQQYAKEFIDKHQGVKIQFTPIPDGPLDTWMVSRSTAGTLPDIVNLGFSVIGRYAHNGTSVDISKYLPKGYIEKFMPGFQSVVRHKGGVYGVPGDASSFATYYRTDLLQQIGLKPATSVNDALTWDQQLDATREMKKLTGHYGMAWGFINSDSANRWLPFIYQNKGNLFNEDLSKVVFNSPEVVDALTYSNKYYKEGLISPSNTVKASNANTANSLFTTGQAGFEVHDSAEMTTIKTGQLAEDQWSGTYLFRGEVPATLPSGSANIVTKDSKNPELAAEFLAYCFSRENIIKRLRDTNGLPSMLGITAQDVGYAYRPDLVQVWIDQLATGPAQVGRESGGLDYEIVRQVLGAHLDLMFIGQATPKETATGIAAELPKARFTGGAK